jgi:hypothetical protein
MARVLAHSCKVNSPETPLVIHEVREPDDDIVQIGRKHERQEWFIANTRKTRHLTQLVRDARDGELLCLLDVDTMVIRDLTPILEPPTFDLGLTGGRENRYMLNTGVVFVRVSEATRALCAAWELRAIEMLADKTLHDKWRPKWGGINQSSLASLIAKPGALRVQWFKTREWNAISADHGEAIRYQDERRSRIVHLLGQVRRHLDVTRFPRYNKLKRIVELWQAYEGALRCQAP